MRLKVEKSVEGMSEKWILEENGLYHLVALKKNVLEVEVNSGEEALSYMINVSELMIYKGK